LTAIAVFVAVIELVFGLSAPDFVSGLALGSLYGIIGVGIVLIYKTSRVINFAAGAVGAVPAVIALVLVLEYGVNYLVALPIVLVGGPVLGLIADLVMRRFDSVPRLIATVMTIAVAQSLAVLGFFIPVWLGQNATNQGTAVTTPWQHLVWHTSRGQPLLTGNEIAAFLTVVVVTVGLAAFLRLRPFWFWVVMALTSTVLGPGWWLAVAIGVAGWYLLPLQRQPGSAGDLHPLAAGREPWLGTSVGTSSEPAGRVAI